MLLLTNEDVRQVLTMQKCLEAVEESTLRAGRGQLLKWDAGRLLEEKGSFGGSGSAYGLRLNPVFDLVDGLALLRINSWATIAVELFGKKRQVLVPATGDRNPHRSEKPGWLHLYNMGTGRLLSIDLAFGQYTILMKNGEPRVVFGSFKNGVWAIGTPDIAT